MIIFSLRFLLTFFSAFQAGSWDCDGCYVNNPVHVLVCPACNTTKPGSEPQKHAPAAIKTNPGGGFSFAALAQAGNSGSSAFGNVSVGGTSVAPAKSTGGGFSFGSAATGPATFGRLNLGDIL